LDETAVAERRLVDVRAGIESVEIADADLGRDRGERVDEPALREPALEGRLAAFEVGLEAARAGILALLAASGRLAQTGPDAASEADLVAGGARGLRELAQRLSHCRSPRRAPGA